MNFSIAWEGYILCKCSKKAKILHWYLVKQLDLRNFCLFGAILLMNFCNYMRETFCFFRVVLLMNFKFREILYKCSKKARSSCIQPICLAMAFGKVAWLTEIRAKEKFNSLLFLYPKKLLARQLPILIILKEKLLLLLNLLGPKKNLTRFSTLSIYLLVIFTNVNVGY